MIDFSVEQKAFLKDIGLDRGEDDWGNIRNYAVIVEKRKEKELLGLAGVTFRYKILPSLFIAVKKNFRKKGIGTKLLKKLLSVWMFPLFLTFYKKNSFLKKYYAKFGFRVLLSSWGKNRVLCVRWL